MLTPAEKLLLRKLRNFMKSPSERIKSQPFISISFSKHLEFCNYLSRYLSTMIQSIASTSTGNPT